MTWLGEPVVRLRRALTGYDSANRPIFIWDDLDLDAPCGFDPGGTTEPAEVGRTQVVSTPRAYFLEPVDVLAGDRLILRDRLWDVQGDPALWVDPFGSDVGGTVVELQASSEEG